MDKTTFINEILAELQDDLTNEQLTKLEAKLTIKLHKVRLEEECTAMVLANRSWEKILRKFVGCKRLENCAESTLIGYCRFINKMRIAVGKKIEDVTTDDLRRVCNSSLLENALYFPSYYLAHYQRASHKWCFLFLI